MIKNKSKKCNVTIRKRQRKSINNTTLFQIVITINESRHTVTIDSNSKNNYMLRILTKRKGFSTRLKSKDAFETFVIEKEFVNKVNQETISLFVTIQQHHKELIFDLIKTIIN